VSVPDVCYQCGVTKPDWRQPCASGHDDGDLRRADWQDQAGKRNGDWWQQRVSRIVNSASVTSVTKPDATSVTKPSVTKPDTSLREAGEGGRPKLHGSAADRQRAYRQRLAAQKAGQS